MEPVTKKCQKCGIEKEIYLFAKEPGNLDGRTGKCLCCIEQQYLIQRRTKEGVCTRIYATQRRKSKERNHPLPPYSLQELRLWAFSQDVFHKLYNEWVLSGYDTWMKPSCDRLDDYKPYTFDNMRLVTWKDNQAKEYEDRKTGLNNKLNIEVSQYTKQGELIKVFHSQQHASREMRIKSNAISRCRRGLQKIAGGFVWK
jgi:hypothetical protein